MKVIFLLFCTLFVIENFVVADDEFTKPPLLKDLYHKKSKERILNGPKLLNSNNEFTKSSLLKDFYHKKSKKSVINGPKLLNRKISKVGKLAKLRTKKHLDDGEYTVFPSQAKKQAINVPSSPYFSADHNGEPKLRVKKVLPDFWNVHDRKKRSPDEKAKVAGKVEEKKIGETKATAAKANTKEAKKAEKPVPKSILSGETKKVGTKKGENAPATTANVAKPKANNTRRSGGKGKSRGKKSKRPGHKRSKSPTRKSKAGKRSGSDHKKNKKPAKHTSHSNKKPAKKGKELETRRLIAGRDGLIENYPYVVSIQKDGEHWCAGALLNQRLVITTANCVWKSSRMSRMKIRAGSRHLEHGGQVVAISEVLKHPGWSIRKNPDYDIALLLTSDFVKFSHSCHAVDLPNRVMMPIFDDAWVTSWGADRRDGVYVPQGLTLQIYHGRLLNRDKCNNITMRFGVMVTENFICLEQIGRRAPCTRDTGAPAVSDGVLWGLASWGIRKMCGTERFPAMFSYVASQNNMDFIINGTRYLMSEERLSPFLDRFPFTRARNNSALRV